MNVRSLKKPLCPSCSNDAVYPFLSARESTKYAVLCGRDTVQLSWPENRRVELDSFVASVKPIVQKLIHNPHLAAFEFEGHRIVLFRDGRMLIHGTKDIIAARKVAA